MLQKVELKKDSSKKERENTNIGTNKTVNSESENKSEEVPRPLREKLPEKMLRAGNLVSVN